MQVLLLKKQPELSIMNKKGIPVKMVDKEVVLITLQVLIIKEDEHISFKI